MKDSAKKITLAIKQLNDLKKNIKTANKNEALPLSAIDFVNNEIEKLACKIDFMLNDQLDFLKDY